MSKEPWDILRDAERDRWLEMIIGDYNWENMELAFSFFERFDDPLEAADEMCKLPEVAIDIPVTRKAQKFSTQHKSVLFEDLMRFCGKHDLIAYKYYTREWSQYEFETFYLLYRVPREQIFVGARMFWDNDTGVHNLEHLFTKTVEKVRNEIMAAYGDLADKSVLDLGCGTGRLPAAFPDIGAYTGVDQSDMMLKTASLYAPDDSELICLPIKEYSSGARFHVIAAIDILQHSERPRDLALYILNNFRSNYVLFRTVINDLDYPVYHATSMGTTSVSQPLSYYERLAQDMAFHHDATAEIFHCEPLEGEKKCQTQTHGIIIKVKRGTL